MVEHTEKQVQDTLRLSVEDLFELKFSEGVDFLQYIRPEEISLALRDSKAYWNWWRTLWANRDRKLLAMIETDSDGFLYQKPLPFKENNWLACRKIDWSDGLQFYTDYHIQQIEMIHQYPNDEVIKSAMRQQYDKEKELCEIQK